MDAHFELKPSKLLLKFMARQFCTLIFSKVVLIVHSLYLEMLKKPESPFSWF